MEALTRSSDSLRLDSARDTVALARLTAMEGGVNNDPAQDGLIDADGGSRSTASAPAGSVRKG